MRVRRLAAAGTTAMLLPFAACSDGDSNADPVDPSSSATNSPSETASKGPTLPPEARGSDESAAKAFVVFYFEELTRALQSGDTKGFRRYSAPSCETCTNFADLIDDTYDKGGRYETQGLLIKRIHPIPADDPRNRIFVLSVRETERRLYDEHGELVDTAKPQLRAMRIILRRPSSAWVIRRLDLVVA